MLTSMISRSLQRHVGDAMRRSLAAPVAEARYFSAPLHEEALLSSRSVAWRVFKNPVALFVGGVAAVILELAEPAVCAGVWGRSSFRADPGRRLRHTGLATLATVYAAHSIAEPLIARVVRMHASIGGRTDQGLTYSANDPDLLAWVHATAAFGFVEAYRRYAEPLSPGEHDQFYREGAPIAHRYGARVTPESCTGMTAYIESMSPRLSPNPAIGQFLQIMVSNSLLPGMFHWLQPMLLRAAVDLLPDPLRARLGLTERFGLRPAERRVARWAGAAANRMVLVENPAVQSCVRLGLPHNFLYT